MACLSSRARYCSSTQRGGAVSRDGRIWRLAWLIVFAVLLSLKSFFFRQLLAALLLFTVAFVIAAALIVLCVGIDYAADSAVSWAESQVRSIYFSIHHSVTPSVHVSLRAPEGAARRIQGIERNRWGLRLLRH